MEERKFYICKTCGTINIRKEKGYAADYCECKTCKSEKYSTAISADLDEKLYSSDNIRITSGPIQNFSTGELVIEKFELEVSFKKSKRPMAKVLKDPNHTDQDIVKILQEHNTQKKTDIKTHKIKLDSKGDRTTEKIKLYIDDYLIDNAKSQIETLFNNYTNEQIFGEYIALHYKSSRPIDIIENIMSSPHMEILIKAGYVGISSRDRRYNTSGSSPHEILGLPKDKCKFLREFYDPTFLKNHTEEIAARSIYGQFDSYYDLFRNKKDLDLVVFSKIINKIYDNTQKGKLTNSYENDIWKYSYNGMSYPYLETIFTVMDKAKKHNIVIDVLIDYLTKKVREDQGLYNVKLAFKIYGKMLDLVDELEVELDKYPKSLITAFDRLSYLKAIKYDELCKKKFQEKINAYSMFKYEDDKYMIILPQEPNDMRREGDNLGNCIASYIENVTSGNSRIFFMREKANPTKSLVAIELDSRNRICQSHGYKNRSLTREENNFVDKWMKFIKEEEKKPKEVEQEYKDAV